MQIKSNQIKSDQIKSNQIKSNQIKSNQIKSNQNFINVSKYLAYRLIGDTAKRYMKSKQNAIDNLYQVSWVVRWGGGWLHIAIITKRERNSNMTVTVAEVKRMM